LHSFLPIVVGDEDSSPTSDLTLQYALKQVTAKANKKTGIFTLIFIQIHV
jgi:hypothetical protein